MKKYIPKLISFLRSRYFLVVSISVVVLVGSASISFAAVKTQVIQQLVYQAAGQSVDRPFVVEFGVSYARIEKVEITPEVPGDWRYQTDMLGVTGLEFTPRDKFTADQEYQVVVHQAKRYLTGRADKLEFKFRTEAAPGITHFSLVDNSDVELSADYRFEAEIDDSKIDVEEVSLVTEPGVDLVKEREGSRLTWRPRTLLPQGGALKVQLVLGGGEVLLERVVRVVGPPELEGVSKTSDIVPGDKIIFRFKQVIDIKSLPAKALSFDLPGDGRWLNGQEYEFTTTDIEPGRTYETKIKAGLRTPDGGVLVEDIVLELSTRGAVSLVSYTPQGQELGQAEQHLQLTFNQPVDKQSVEERLSLSRGSIKSKTWSGNTLKIHATDFGYQQAVRINIAAGVGPSGFGAPSTSSLGFSFTTEVQSRRLNVPYYKQAYAQSCEAASLRMVLAYRGMGASDWDILQRFGYNPIAKNHDSNTWDDPQKQFVGDVNGQQGAGTGWGVFAEPVAAAVRSYGRQASTHYGVSAQLLAQQLYNDRPVVLWGIWGSSAQIQTWTTADGGTASGPFPMHVRLVVGVKGSVENPLGFYVHDPITGSAYWSTTQLMSNTQKAGPANQAVVIY